MRTKSEKLSSKIRDMCSTALFTAVIAVLAQISVPMPLGVPLTLQTFAVPFTGIILGAKKGVAAVVVYLLLGALGAPVFTGFSGGFHRIIGPWGGFLLSFPFMALIVGLGADSGRKFWLAASLAAGSAVNLSMGTLQFALVSGVGLKEAFFAAAAPFIIIETLKMAAAFGAGGSVKHILKKHGV